jgi:acyl-CoA thioester hydrolase
MGARRPSLVIFDDPHPMTDAHPYLSDRYEIEPGWVDYNGHLNMAFYNVVFDRACDDFVVTAGLGPDYLAKRGCSYMTAEIHVCYLREVFLGDPLQVRMRILDLDDKRLHLFAELIHAEDGWVSATSEQMYLHLDMRARRVVPWSADVRAGLEALWAPTRHLAPPERAGRRIGIPKKV